MMFVRIWVVSMAETCLPCLPVFFFFFFEVYTPSQPKATRWGSASAI